MFAAWMLFSNRADRFVSEIGPARTPWAGPWCRMPEVASVIAGTAGK
jgi:hypothetical protein